MKEPMEVSRVTSAAPPSALFHILLLLLLERERKKKEREANTGLEKEERTLVTIFARVQRGLQTGRVNVTGRILIG